MHYTTRPLSDRTWLRPAAARKRSQFDSTWTDTLELLDREIGHLKGRDVVIEVDVREQDIRLDGMIRGNARAPEHPAVVVAFDTPDHGPQLHQCDKFERSYKRDSVGWQENVRAIAKTLEALRAVTRYGSAETGQQYTGFKALPSGRAMPPSHMTREEALGTIARLSAEFPGHYAHDHDMRRYAEHPDEIRKDWKKARVLHHPDRHDNDRRLWDQVEQAARVLGVSS